VGGTAWALPPAEADRLATVRRALERGITFFDTAPTYGDGASEILLGRALQADRDRVAIATKVGRATIRAAPSRHRCGGATDYVDLIQLHEALEGWEGGSSNCTRCRRRERPWGWAL